MLLWPVCILLIILTFDDGVSSISIRRNIGINLANETIEHSRNSNLTSLSNSNSNSTGGGGSWRKFQICEQFIDGNETFDLNLHGNGITVISRLSA